MRLVLEFLTDDLGPVCLCPKPDSLAERALAEQLLPGAWLPCGLLGQVSFFRKSGKPV